VNPKTASSEQLQIDSTPPRVLVVIVNYRTPELVLDCLDSLKPEVEANPGTHVELVEGGSGDDSAAVLREGIDRRGFADWVTLNLQEKNRGFAGGNNAAIKPAMASEDPPDFIWLLNPDTLVHPGALGTLIEYLRHHPDVGIAGSRLEDRDPPTPQRSAFRFPTLANQFENAMQFAPVSKLLDKHLVAPPIREDAHRIDWVAGASMLVRRKVFEAVGPLDDRYFMYFEETDFCLAAKRAGFACAYVPESRVVHLVGQASGVTGKQKEAGPPKRRPAYWFESRRRYFTKNHGRAYAIATDALFALGYMFRRVKGAVLRRPSVDPAKFLSDFLHHAAWRAR
jgi:GT2 family glycosyltransferase